MKNLFEKLHNDKICLSYLGSFEDDITDKLIGISEYYLENKSELGKIKNKVSFLIAECFQNIVRHKEPQKNLPTTSSNHTDFFQLNVLDDRTVLSSCNLISEKYVEELEKKLIQVNSLDAEGLKKLYNDVMQFGFSEKGGAGLGLIEMARKSGLPLKYLFKNVGDGFQRFFLSLEIITKKDNAVEKVKIEDIEKMYNSLMQGKVLMMYKGDLSKDIIIPLVEMVQRNFADSENISGKEKRSVIALIEALQNISKHGKSVNGDKEGIFNIIKSDDLFTIQVGNVIDKLKHSSFEKSLNDLKKMSLEDIKTLYKKKLLDPEITTEGNCGLGLLEIAKNSSGNFDYSFTPTLENDYFYSLTINI
ncbi:MAG: SiaB family protein kinase [Bacteroidota bacterium]|nr:SiaB family protein kinase [Bacteroidota bacterium]